jgi:hypothetical protein
VKDKIVLVGLQLHDRDVMRCREGGERWGVELFAAQADALVRARGDPAAGHVGGRGGCCGPAPVSVLRASQPGRTCALAAHCSRWPWPSPAAVAASVVLYRTQGLLLNLAYPVAAFLLGRVGDGAPAARPEAKSGPLRRWRAACAAIGRGRAAGAARRVRQHARHAGVHHAGRHRRRRAAR